MNNPILITLYFEPLYKGDNFYCYNRYYNWFYSTRFKIQNVTSNNKIIIKDPNENSFIFSPIDLNYCKKYYG